MIKVKINDKKITVSGHANYDEYGKDIVCSSVSSIITTTVNAIYMIDSKSINYNDDGNTVTIEVTNNSEITDKLITNMLNMFNDLESDYPKNIKIIRNEG